MSTSITIQIHRERKRCLLWYITYYNTIYIILSLEYYRNGKRGGRKNLGGKILKKARSLKKHVNTICCGHLSTIQKYLWIFLFFVCYIDGNDSPNLNSIEMREKR
jgi:hypothetical protein